MVSSSALPAPRPGLLGSWDRFVGPGMPWDETLMVVGSGLLGAVFAAWVLVLQDANIWLIALGAVIALDVVGGAVCNVTETTKRWYHRPGVTFGQQASFISLHVLHIAIVAWAFRGEGFDTLYALTLSACLLIAMVAVLAAPVRLKLPVAAGFYLIAIGLLLCLLGATPGLEWFVPALFLKLLIGHLVP